MTGMPYNNRFQGTVLRAGAEPERYDCRTFPRSHRNPTRFSRLPILSDVATSGALPR
jgi:hypothetical protein